MCASTESQIIAGIVRITSMLIPVQWEKERQDGEQQAKGLSVAYSMICKRKFRQGQMRDSAVPDWYHDIFLDYKDNKTPWPSFHFVGFLG